jgi:hypothetical protein
MRVRALGIGFLFLFLFPAISSLDAQAGPSPGTEYLAQLGRAAFMQ